MYRIVIVDDDAIIRKGLSMNINWEENGFQLMGTAGDGETAITLIEKVKPHIVITDINMPFMDGLELTRIIKSKYLKTKIILLSGYDEFEYAKEGLKLRAYDYILKPVDTKQLLETVKNATWEIDNEKKIQIQIEKSKPLLRQKFLTRLLEGSYNEDEIASEIEFLDIPLRECKYVTAVIKADDYYNANYHINVMKKELLKFCIFNISDELLKKKSRGIVFDSGKDEIIIICNRNIVDGNQITSELYDVCEEVRKKIDQYLGTTVTIGIGKAYNSAKEITQSYIEACSAVEFRHITGKNKVLLIQDTGMPRESNRIDFFYDDKALIQKLKLGLFNETIKIIDDIEYKLISRHFVTLNYTQMIGMEIAVMIFKEVEGWGEIKNKILYKYNIYSFNNEVFNCQTIKEIFTSIRTFIEDICSYVNENRKSQKQIIVDSAMEYIQNNYAKEGLSLHDVSSKLHISPTYLSIIFKQEKNINFTDFVLEVRMNKAMEFLRNSDMQVYKIAQKVGYLNSHYFSTCFKKYKGLSPSEYKTRDGERLL